MYIRISAKSVISIFTIIFLIGAGFWWGPSLLSYGELHVAPYTQWTYAVNLANGQTVFGHVRASQFKHIRLTDVHYFQTLDVNGEKTNSLVSQVQNTALSPYNYLIINREHIVSIERIGEDSQIAKIINGTP